MPVHDWTRVDAGIFHDFHHEWISTMRRALNDGLLPSDYYALAEQQAAGFGPDVLTLHGTAMAGDDGPPAGEPAGSGRLVLAPPKARFTAESAGEFYRRKKSTIVVRHVSGDDMVAIVELVSPGNKSSRNAFRALVEKACELLEHKINLLIVDVFPPTRRDPHGIHAAVWDEIADEPFALPDNQPLTLASYESGLTVKGYVETVAVGERLPAMPLFLEPGAHMLVPLEETYESAFAAVPRRWKSVLEPL
jgi:hypothetical protein